MTKQTPPSHRFWRNSSLGLRYYFVIRAWTLVILFGLPVKKNWRNGPSSLNIGPCHAASRGPLP